MNVLGWVLFAFGVVLLFFFGVVGLDSGPFIDGRIGNLPGMLVGSALMISGSVFVGVSKIFDQLSIMHVENKMMIGFPHNKVLPVSQRSANSWVFANVVYETEEKANAARQDYLDKYGR